MDRARADDDEQAVVDAVQYVGGRLTTVDDGPGQGVVQRQFVVQRQRRDQRDRLLDPPVDDRGLFARFRQGVHGSGTFPPDGRGWSQTAG